MAAPDDNAGLAAEMVGESALTLGRAGARLQAALDALAAHDAAGGPDGEARRDLVDSAGEQAWGFLVLRNALGWYDDEYALAAYQVPREVRGRMGARRRADLVTTAADPAPLEGFGKPYR